MGYWKSTVVPKFKKLFEKNNVKKAGAAEACKTFDDAKEDYSKEFEEKKADLKAKVLEIYEASAAEIKAVVKERKEGALKKVSSAVEKFLEELSKIEFPGSKPAHEACCKYGPTYVEGPIYFVFEKVSTFIVVEEKKEEAPPATEPEAPAAPVEETSSKEKEIVVEEEKKEEVVVVAEVEKTPESEAPKAEVEKTVPEPEATKAAEVAPTEPPKAC
ncbi:putative DREPP family protein [Helianthus annuus]|uniref:DREPP family protein n=1 Tax=Helianthus annuus TaxID=4232 RepID=A0A251TVN0_HELAN|nr:plasma membrane-associated cation-binding protein 1 [Helianthus annuus]KAF5790970.1 putative DREPP family protein [Helianthus annuus]KAJ0526108.1 putative DREPP family protein [Helianthus annuus]KAJ0534430.1 putative DREPP family protein [Helianthus annuus]KAJ0707543.1 putative DREPP family protein [Helianthus annuus]KAJ0893225.1 putative DREPP family protein [Helianthus annuus]